MKSKSHVILIIIGFFTITIIPNIIMSSGLEKKSRFAETINFPELNTKRPLQTFSKLKSYFIENYGLKHTLVNAYIGFKKNVLLEDPIPYRVVEGKKGWYFLGNYNNKILDNTFGVNKYSEIDLYRMKQNLISLKDYLKNKGVDFYFVITPNKSTIYKENLPYKLKDRETPMSQFLSIINSEDALNIVDLRSVLTKHKNDSTTLYHKTDTHWNHFGAYLCYQEIINKIATNYKTIESIPLIQFNKVNSFIEGDITRMINVNTKEKITKYEKPENSSVIIIENNDGSTTFINEEKKIKILMYRDSFANYWIDYFNESFNEAKYYKYNKGIKKSDITKSKTDILILEVGERHFDILLKNLKLIN